MEENSLANSKQTPASMTTQEEGSLASQNEQPNETSTEVKVGEDDTSLPPSFHCTVTKEQLCNDNCPYVFWANIRIHIAEKPVDPVTTMFEHLKSFLNNMLKIDAHFLVFAHNLSKFESINDLLEALDDLDLLPNDVDEWLQYFQGA